MSGCWIPNTSAVSFMDQHENGADLIHELVERSGIEGLESALVLTLDHLREMFGILPGFSFYRERGSPNAKAMSIDLLGNRSDGTVLFGLQLLRSLLDLPRDGDAAIVSVCAHEFAHILSYSNGMYDTLRPPEASAFRSEQFADFMSGYYAGRRKLADDDFPAVVFASAVSRYGGGDHGTSQQRSLAVEEGFLAAYVRKLEPASASRHALSFSMGEL